MGESCALQYFDSFRYISPHTYLALYDLQRLKTLELNNTNKLFLLPCNYYSL